MSDRTLQAVHADPHIYPMSIASLSTVSADPAGCAGVQPRGHILFVDDDSHFLEGILRLLRRRAPHWHLSLAAGADAAWAILQDGEIDVVVTDLRMPGADGFALLQRIRAAAPCQSLPVVVLTGALDHALKRQALDAGASDLLTKPVDADDLLARLRSALRLKFCLDRLETQNTLLAAHNLVAEQRVRMRTAELAQSQKDLAWCLARAAEYRDRQTGAHVHRVCDYSRAIAYALGLPSEFIEILVLASPLHDIGKLAIPDVILNKPGPLTDAEETIMKSHCAIGAAILQGGQQDASSLIDAAQPFDAAQHSGPLVSLAATIALCHHEKWDGTGYPRGLQGEAIPLAARIVALADAFDAMTSVRPYKSAYTVGEALSRIRRDVGRHFCPTIYAAFEQTLE